MKNISHFMIKDLNSYCKSRCQHIIVTIQKEQLNYLRGLYKGYLYIVKLTSFIQKYHLVLTQQELYNIIKIQKNSMLGKYHKEPLYIKGILHSLYDCLNYISQ